MPPVTSNRHTFCCKRRKTRNAHVCLYRTPRQKTAAAAACYRVGRTDINCPQHLPPFPDTSWASFHLLQRGILLKYSGVSWFCTAPNGKRAAHCQVNTTIVQRRISQYVVLYSTRRNEAQRTASDNGGVTMAATVR